MSHENYIEQANELDIKELAERYVQLKKGGKEWRGPCPVCKGGTDRFYVIPAENRAGCRQCATGWDTVALNAAIKGITQGESARELLGITEVSHETRPVIKPAVKVEERELSPAEWHKKAMSTIEKGKLNASHSVFRNYLTTRGLTERTIARFHLGFTSDAWDPHMKAKRQAVVIPWASRQQIYAVKYRYIDDKGELRYGSLGGGSAVLFGSHIPKNYPVLMVTEGEFNAMAIYESGAEADVISIGSQNNLRSYEKLRPIADQYKYIVGWFDEIDSYLRFKDAMGGLTNGIISKGLHGMDANDVLLSFGHEAIAAYIERSLKVPTDICPLCEGEKRFYAHGADHICPCQFPDRKTA
jgi:hypothetical protein